MPNAFIYPHDGEFVEVTIKGWVRLSDANGFNVKDDSGMESYVHPAHIVTVKSIEKPLIPGAIYRDDAGVVWQVTNAEVPLRRFGDVGHYSRNSARGNLTLLWQPDASR
jgi:hypothetical protein